MNSDITQVLLAIERGDATVNDDLLPIVYHELRSLAAHKLGREEQGHTLQATALVHEVWMRLAGGNGQPWQNRRHFFAAAAESMRRILVESARRRRSTRRGGSWKRVHLEDYPLPGSTSADDILAIDEALERLAAADAQTASLVKLRYFAGLTIPQTARALGISSRTADRMWAYARAWLLAEVRGETSRSS